MPSTFMLENLETICGIIDTQGFIKDGNFVARELSITMDGRSYKFDLLTGLNSFEMTEKDKKTNHIVRKYVGLDYERTIGNEQLKSKMMRSEDLLYHLKDIHSVLSSKEKPNFGVKQRFLKDLLVHAGIPFVNLDDERLNCPSLGELMKRFSNVKICHTHGHSRIGTNFGNGPFRCSLQKTKIIKYWVESVLRGGELIASADYKEYMPTPLSRR